MDKLTKVLMGFFIFFGLAGWAAVVTLFVWQLNQPGPIVLEGCTEVHRPGTVAVSPRNLPKPRDTVLVRTR